MQSYPIHFATKTAPSLNCFTVIDRFGTKDVHYSKSDDRHFTITAKVEISDQFFCWLLGFGKRVQITSPPEVIDEFSAYLDKIREMY